MADIKNERGTGRPTWEPGKNQVHKEVGRQYSRRKDR